jgi:hypothetical protein
LPYFAPATSCSHYTVCSNKLQCMAHWAKHGSDHRCSRNKINNNVATLIKCTHLEPDAHYRWGSSDTQFDSYTSRRWCGRCTLGMARCKVPMHIHRCLSLSLKNKITKKARQFAFVHTRTDRWQLQFSRSSSVTCHEVNALTHAHTLTHKRTGIPTYLGYLLEYLPVFRLDYPPSMTSKPADNCGRQADDSSRPHFFAQLRQLGSPTSHKFHHNIISIRR